MRRQRRRAVIMLAGLMNAFLGTNIGYSAGIIHLGLLEKHKKSPNLVSWAGALFTSVFCLAGKKGFLSLSLSPVHVVDTNFFLRISL